MKQARLRAELSQEELAYRAGVHWTYVSQVERGIKSPTLGVILRLARALGEPAHVLVQQAEDGSTEHGKGPPMQPPGAL